MTNCTATNCTTTKGVNCGRVEFGFAPPYGTDGYSTGGACVQSKHVKENCKKETARKKTARKKTATRLLPLFHGSFTTPRRCDVARHLVHDVLPRGEPRPGGEPFLGRVGVGAVRQERDPRGRIEPALGLRTRSAHCQHTASSWSAHGRHMLSACCRHVVSPQSAHVTGMLSAHGRCTASTRLEPALGLRTAVGVSHQNPKSNKDHPFGHHPTLGQANEINHKKTKTTLRSVFCCALASYEWC